MNRNLPWIFGGLLVLFIVGVPYEYYRYRYTTLKRLRVVDEGKLYRSGCLTVDGFEEAIREYGIRTIVNLQDEAVDPDLPKTFFSMQRERESELCKRLGLRYEFLKVDLLTPDEEALHRPPTVDAFFKIMDDPTAWPVLIHCKAGLHRTGVLVALYRMEYDGYSVYQALEEMRDNGFSRNPSYSPNDYIRQYLANYVPRNGRLDEEQASFIRSVSGAIVTTDSIRYVPMFPATGAIEAATPPAKQTTPAKKRAHTESRREVDKNAPTHLIPERIDGGIEP